MFMTSISLSFVFLGLSLICIGAFVYFKLIVVKTNDESPNKDKIVGNMKDPVNWRKRNNRMSYLTLFWAIVSLGVFIYLKFFFKAGLLPSYYTFIYIGVLVLSMILFRAKETAKY